jgi:hypothetical protein
MVRLRFFLVLVLALSLMHLLPYACTGQSSQVKQLEATTLQIKQAVQSELDKLDLDMSAAAAEMTNTGLSGPEAIDILKRLYNKYRYMIEFATADTNYKIIAIVPEGYSGFQGGYVAIYENGQLITEKVTKPELRYAVVMFEFFYTDAVIWPIFSSNGKAIGSVSALFEPQKLFTRTIGPDLIPSDVAVNIVQLDGLNIYASGYTDTYSNILTDPAVQPYKDLVKLGKKIVARESGNGSYTSVNKATGQTVKKQACWTSVGLHGTEWRIVSSQDVAN